MPSNFFVKKRKLDSGFQSQGKNKRSRDGSDNFQSGGLNRKIPNNVAFSSKKRPQPVEDANEEIVSSEDEEYDFDEIEGEEGDRQTAAGGEAEDVYSGDRDPSFDVTFKQPSAEDRELTAEELKLQMAKQYIEEVREKVRKFEQEREDEEESDEDEEDEALGADPETRKAAQFLRYESAVKNKLIRKNLSRSITDTPSLQMTLKGHKNSITCGCVCSKGQYLYTGGRDCSIIKWSLTSSSRMWLIKSALIPKKKLKAGQCTPRDGHKSHINSLAISYDSKFLVSGASEPDIFVWNPVDASLLYKLKGHKSTILCLKFKFCTHQLFSTSADRFVKLWQVQDRTLMDNLCGHEGPITDLDCISGSASSSFGKPITCGSTDRSLRLWKIAESSQLIFSHSALIDCVCYLSDNLFITGDCNGAVCLWTTHKKKPLFTQQDAHAPKAVCSLAAIPYSDVVASGSSEGLLKIWKVTQPSSESFQKLVLLTKIDTLGFITFITFTPDSRFLVFALSPHAKLGRWEVLQSGKSSTRVYKIIPDTESLELSMENILKE